MQNTRLTTPDEINKMSKETPVILITGGSRGIGRAIALRAAHAGYDVAITYVEDSSAAEDVLAKIKLAGRKGYARQCDASAESSEISALINDVSSAIGPVTYLVNNVGIIGRIGMLVDLPEDILRESFDVNVIGTILGCKIRAARWIADGVPGSIVNISSIAATLGAPNEYVHYAASNAAIEAFSIGLSKELGPHDIRVNVVSPGTTQTEIHARGGDPGRPERVSARVPLGRVGEPDEIAAAVMWLHSSEPSYATGATVRIGGGL